MYKNIAIGVLIIAVIAEGGLLIKVRSSELALRAQATKVLGTSTSTSRPPPQMLTSGMKLADSSISQFAFKVAPGKLDDSAKTALIGWDITSVVQKDGSTVVTLNPKDSGDQKQVYTVKPGLSLYFVEMSKGDDNTDTNSDTNLRDDYGIMVDANGTVQ